ncbi:N-acetyltransferase [Polaribacter sp. ALD11]|uniref:GNAT family N-acetyltransferase n=1 Tax=Polaribacter sp. ALD11 TaxID=2058137 RepID=UPI000C307266|nr:GNAT family N-acetyltransferase [Polaribacter sp. ALD11]AUC84503.1 N-acetyltransferase [Polaribacter sp. ALD11]
MIFETERLLIRKLNSDDLQEFHVLENNPEVLKYATGTVKNFEENSKELKYLISLYIKPKNDFWIYAIERKQGAKFIGTLALVKDNIDDEIGYRFVEECWGKGYGYEVCEGLLYYSKQLKIKKLVAYVVLENKASVKILERLKFKRVKYFRDKDVSLSEIKYQIIL